MDWSSLQYPLDKEDVLFIKDPRVLWKANRLFEFFPTKEMQREEQINASMRLAIIYATIYYPISRDRKAFLPLIVSVITAIVYRTMSKQEGFITDNTFTKAKDLGPSTIIEPTVDNPFMNQLTYSPEDLNTEPMDPMDPRVKEKIRDAYLDNGRHINSDDPYQDDGYQRFYHVPKMDRDQFAQFLHAGKLDENGKVTSCKQSGGIPCLLDNDPRRSRKPFYQIDDRVKDTMDQATFGTALESRLQ